MVEKTLVFMSSTEYDDMISEMRRAIEDSVESEAGVDVDGLIDTILQIFKEKLCIRIIT